MPNARPPKRLPLRPLAAERHLAAADPAMARAIKVCGPCKLTQRPANLHGLCTAIIGQQLSTVVASAISKRFGEEFGVGHEFDHARVLAATHEELRAPGLSNAKARAVRETTEFWTARKLSEEALLEMHDDEIIETLTQVRGIGPWTVKMLLMFRLRRPDILPPEDLGIRAGMKLLYGLDEMPQRDWIEEKAEPWRPYRTVGSWYCWRWLEHAQAQKKAAAASACKPARPKRSAKG